MSSRSQRKRARTRLGLLFAFRDRLAERPIEDVNIRELTEAIDVSEATFYNHFSSKADLAIYFVQLWSIDVGWHAAAARPNGPRAAIAAIFDATARDIARAPRVMGEIIAMQTRMADRPDPEPLSAIEKQLAFPDRPGIEAIEGVGLDGLLKPLLHDACASAELPAQLDQDAALLALASVFFGVPLILARRAPERIGALYRQQLDLVWAGLRAVARKESP